MNKILIIGCGQLGSRHLQSLALLKRDLEICLVDPNAAGLEKAVSLFQANSEFKQTIRTHTSLQEIKNTSYDITINASTSAARLEILQEMKNFEVITNFLILEKVLFQKLSDYSDAEKYISPSKTWVNCPRRMYPFYQDLKKSISGKVQAEFAAQNWGLCCNSVHFIDLIQYLTGETPLQVSTDQLKEKVFPTKREGYIEFYGSLVVEFSGGSSLRLSCTEEPCDWQLKISGKNLHYTSQETLGQSQLNDKAIPIRAPYQSELTAVFVEKLLTKNHCDLPLYAESKIAHEILIKELLQHYKKITGIEVQTLPIT